MGTVVMSSSAWLPKVKRHNDSRATNGCMCLMAGRQDGVSGGMKLRAGLDDNLLSSIGSFGRPAGCRSKIGEKPQR